MQVRGDTTRSGGPTAAGRVEVLLFARAVELAGAERIRVDVPTGGRVGDLGACVASQYPALADLAMLSRWADASRFLAEDEPLEHGQTVAMIPPVSGG